MSTLAVALARIAALEARVEALESGGGGASSSGGSSSSNGSGSSRGDGEALPDHLLDNDWADPKIDKDPKQWKGTTQVNRRYSRAPKEWLEMMAHNMEFKASQERSANPVALQTRGKNAGKPWHEATTFKAKLLRAWAKRNASKPSAPARPAPPEDDFGSPSSDANDDFGGSAVDDEIPF